jgi:hypothetical protein
MMLYIDNRETLKRIPLGGATIMTILELFIEAATVRIPRPGNAMLHLRV